VGLSTTSASTDGLGVSAGGVGMRGREDRELEGLRDEASGR
jgi:hypothetical protein